MNNISVFCELSAGRVADVSVELLSKARELADQLKCELEAVVIGKDTKNAANQIMPYGVDKIYTFEDSRLEFYQTLPFSSIIVGLYKETKPQIALMGATTSGRDLGPRVSSALSSGLTADCTKLQLGDHYVKKTDTNYTNLLYQIRPAFGGNIIATIVNPDCRPQMATVREGVMEKKIVDAKYKSEIIEGDSNKYVTEADFAIEIIDREIEELDIDIKNANIIISGGYGMGSKDNFNKLQELANLFEGGEVGATRAAVDAGFAPHERQVGQTGVTVRPKLYFAFGISGQIQHTAGMEDSGIIISINNDKDAPINSIADYVVNGDVINILDKFIKKFSK